MEKITKILVPVDFSTTSENALKYAIRFADKIKANLHILHVPLFENSVGESPASFSLVIREGVNKSERQLKNFVEKVIENLDVHIVKKPTVKTSIELGKVELAIINEAVSQEIDYIIMGTQGKKSTLDKYLGTMASNIVKNAPCSVMVIPKGGNFNKKIELGYATDFSEIDHSEIMKVVKLLKPFQPAIKCVHFNEKQINKTDRINEFRSCFAINSPDLNIEFHNLPVKNSVSFMNFFVENQSINMLVMYKPKRSFFNSIFHNSFTQKMARHVNIPLLVLKQNK